MIGIDTNVLLRLVVDDDPRMSRLAARLMSELSTDSPGFVSMVTVVEYAWVLRRTYRRTPSQVLDHVDDLLASDELEFEDGETVWRAVQLAREGADFADALVKDTCDLWGCHEVVTFDRGAAARLGMRLLG